MKKRKGVCNNPPDGSDKAREDTGLHRHFPVGCDWAVVMALVDEEVVYGSRHVCAGGKTRPLVTSCRRKHYKPRRLRMPYEPGTRPKAG